MTPRLLAAAAAVVDLRRSDDPGRLIDWGAALDRLEAAVDYERQRTRTRVAKMRARRKEQDHASSEG